jgi:hypothetical protein
MRKTILGMLTTTLIAGAASQAVAAPSHHHARNETAVSAQFRNARNAVEQPSQSPWQHSGWSAPAGR